MSVPEQERARCRHHLGYIQAQATSTFVLGVPAGVQTQFMIEGAWDRLLPSAYPKFVELLDRMDADEAQIDENTENVAVNEIGEIKLRDDEFQQIITRYQHWQGALGNMLGVVPNPFDQRPWLAGGGGRSPINVPVLGG